MTVDKLCRNNIHRLLTVLLLPLLVCTGCEAGQKRVQQPNTVGAKDMITYPVGRFAIDIPAEMKLDHQGQTIRYAELEEVIWPADMPIEKARQAEWERHMAEIAKLKAPKGKEGVVIDTTEFAGIGKWSKGVFYHVNPDIPRRIGFEMLFDTGVDSKGVWLKIKGTSREAMEKNVPNIARSYQPRRYGDLKLPPGNWFYTRHGAVNLPYLEQESAAARFLNPLGTKIKIKTMEIHKTEAEGHNLLGRLNAVLATGYNAGVDVKKIRTTKRIVAGLSGEEIVVKIGRAHV